MMYVLKASNGKYIARAPLRKITGILTSDLQSAAVYGSESDCYGQIVYLQEHYLELSEVSLKPQVVNLVEG